MKTLENLRGGATDRPSLHFGEDRLVLLVVVVALGFFDRGEGPEIALLRFDPPEVSALRESLGFFLVFGADSRDSHVGPRPWKDSGLPVLAIELECLFCAVGVDEVRV